MVDLLVIPFIGSTMFVPGGHKQFQLVYLDLIPLCFSMTPLPTIAFFKVFYDIYPCNVSDDRLTIYDSYKYHHLTTLAIVFYCLIFKGNERSI